MTMKLTTPVTPSPREQEVLSKALKILIRKLNPKKIYLFGSRAKGVASQTADFDFAIDGEVPEIDEKREIKKEIGAIMGLYSFDLVFLSEVDSKFRALILSTGKVAYE